MATLSDLIDEARFNTRTLTTRSNLAPSSSLLPIANRALKECWKNMVELESNLVYSQHDIALVDGTPSYNPSFSHSGFLQDGVWMDDEEWFLVEGVEEDKVHYAVDSETGSPERYYLGSDGYVYLLPVPDDTYTTLHILHWGSFSDLELSAVDDDIPWDGIWDTYMVARLEYAINKVYGRDNSLVVAELVGIEIDCTQEVYRHGIRKRRSQSDFFSVPGV